ncbi:hypothetical protein HMPREF3156_01310 [Neisseria sp. HMSC06F02]|nr:hypothetical protein HMPREF3156_01310 [Neisseria sp. HMSC06F02]
MSFHVPNKRFGSDLTEGRLKTVGKAVSDDFLFAQNLAGIV